MLKFLKRNNMDTLQTHFVINQSIPDISIVWTIIIAVCAITSSYIAYKMFKVTKKYTEITENIFLSSQRPYVGRTTFEIFFDKTDHSTYMKFFLKNFGNIPARKVKATIQVFFNEEPIKITGAQCENQIFFPQENLPMNIILPKNPIYYMGIKFGNAQLKIITNIEYYGVTDKKYTTTETEIYNHVIKSFMKQHGDWF